MLMHQHLSLTTKFQLIQFLSARAWRLFPALAVSFAISIFLVMILSSPIGAFQTNILSGLASLAWVSNIVIHLRSGDYFAHEGESNFFLHTWSLGVEFQFYIALGLVFSLVGLVKQELRPRLGAFTLIILACISMFAFLWAGEPYQNNSLSPLLSFYSPLPRFWEFAIGALFALAANSEKFEKLLVRHSRKGAMLAASALIVFVLLSDWEYAFYEKPLQMILFSILCGITLLFLIKIRTVVSKLGKAFSILGDASYSIYLMHWPIWVTLDMIVGDELVKRLIGVASTFLLGFALYVFVERALRVVRINRLRVKTSFALLVTCFSIAGISLSVHAQTWDQSIFVRKVSERPGEYSEGCYNRIAPKSCFYPSNGHVQVLLVGDSTMAQWSPAFREISKSANRSLGIESTFGPGCLVFGTGISMKGYPAYEKDCEEYRSYVETRLAKHENLKVFISPSIQYLDEEKYRIPLQDGSFAQTKLERGQAIASFAEDWIYNVKSKGHQVYLILPLPKFDASTEVWDPSLCAPWAVLAKDCQSQIDLAEWLETRSAYINALSNLNWDGVISPYLDFCPNSDCPTQIGDEQIFADAGHITVEAAKSRGVTLIMKSAAIELEE